MTRSDKKSRIGFSVLDMILLVLLAVSILSTAFQEQIRTFLSGEEGVEIEYTFLIENASEDAKNVPREGETLILSEDGTELGQIVQITESHTTYFGQDDPEDQIRIKTLTCKARVVVKEGQRGFLLEGRSMKPGAQFSVTTESAGFTMVVTMVKNLTETQG